MGEIANSSSNHRQTEVFHFQ